MASGISTAHDIPSDEELDRILNGVEYGNDAPEANDNQTTTNSSNNQAAGVDLGIDKEITLTKTRQPIPKLDEARLLSSAGIPRLQRISKERLRFKGKGYEYRDVARMLNMYQLWLDDLYPRAKFADGLAMIEKLGHKKSLQIIRKDLIDEGRPRRAADHNDEDVDAIVLGDTAMQHTEEDMAESSRLQESNSDIPNLTQNQESEVTGAEDDNPDEDELDLLLAESGGNTVASASAAMPNRTIQHDDDPFADDMEAMAEMEGMW